MKMDQLSERTPSSTTINSENSGSNHNTRENQPTQSSGTRHHWGPTFSISPRSQPRKGKIPLPKKNAKVKKEDKAGARPSLLEQSKKMERFCESLLTKIRQLFEEHVFRKEGLDTAIRTHVELGMARSVGSSNEAGVVLAMKKVRRFQAQLKHEMMVLDFLSKAEIDVTNLLDGARDVRTSTQGQQGSAGIPAEIDLNKTKSTTNLLVLPEIPVQYRDIENQVKVILSSDIPPDSHDDADDSELVKECQSLAKMFLSKP
ncbi:hypothetical protein ACA910_002623 [Epithemia clementina (nom. ined.)]